MRVLIVGEFSGRVRQAFRSCGHDAWSCDLLPAEDGSPYHFQEDCRNLIQIGSFAYRGYPFDRWLTSNRLPAVTVWDLLIAFLPCTYFCNSGVRWFTTIPKHPVSDVRYGPERWTAFRKAVALWQAVAQAPIARIAMENPIPHRYAREAIGVYSQIIQPYQFGHPETKQTCLWLKNLPKLVPTQLVEGRRPRVHHEPPSPDRWKNRSRTLLGVAAAMAEQWGRL